MLNLVMLGVTEMQYLSRGPVNSIELSLHKLRTLSGVKVIAKVN